jgi:hypothetical protein
VLERIAQRATLRAYNAVDHSYDRVGNSPAHDEPNRQFHPQRKIVHIKLLFWSLAIGQTN